MKDCAVNGCTSYRKVDLCISFHKFPSNEVLREQWIKATGVSKGFICSKHFERKCFAPNSFYRQRLTPTAVPSIFNDIVSTEEIEKTRCTTTVGASSMLLDEPNFEAALSAIMKDPSSKLVDKQNIETVSNGVSSIHILNQASNNIMASTSLKDMSDLNDGKDIVCSVFKCVYCGAQLDGDSSRIDWLPIICNNCILKKTEQLKNNKNNNHNAMLDHTKKNTIALCPSCQKKHIEVFCVPCLISVCALCHLKSHKNHDFKTLKDVQTKININLNEKLRELKQIDSKLCVDLDQNKKQMKNLVINKKLAEENIDMEINKLHEKLNECSFKLKIAVEKDFADSINKNERIINNFNKRVKYLRDLSEAILKHVKSYETVLLSRHVINELKCTQKYCHVISKELLRCQPDIQFMCDETLEICISSVRAIGKDTDIITSSTVLDLLENNSDKPSNRDSI